jgi:hypothetical protein
MQSFISFIQQSRTLNEVQYLADRDIFKVTWFHKMMSQVPESQCGQNLTVTKTREAVSDACLHLSHL